MNRLARLLLIAFLESFATASVERGVYFFSLKRLGFSDAANLALALVFGAAYVVGAMASHRLSGRLTEKKLLGVSIAGQLIVHALLAAWAGPATLFVGHGALGLFNGLKWPVVESFISAGRTPAATARAVGRFNIAWASSVPLALVVAGPLISRWAAGLFVLPGAINLVALWLIRPLPPRPAHLPQDHPERLAAGQILRYRGLLGCSRWTMLGSYATLWILAALMPRIFRDLGFAVAAATALAAVVDFVRLVAFVILERYSGWHGRVGPLVVSVAALPVGFFMVLFGASPAVVLAGEVIFGLAAGMTYYAALYYAMVVENASVGAGGVHEGLIGLGFAVGPAAGLIAIRLAPVLGSDVLGTLAGIGPLLGVCWVGAFGSLAAIRRGGGRPTPPADPPSEGPATEDDPDAPEHKP